jgi:hypothetical protein
MKNVHKMLVGKPEGNRPLARLRLSREDDIKSDLKDIRCEMHEGVSKSFWTGCLERELQMVQLSATRCSCIAIL